MNGTRARTRDGFRAAVLAALLVCGMVAGSVAFASPAAAESFEIEHAMALTGEPGEIDVTTAVRVPSGTVELEVTLPEGADVYETDGFEQAGNDGRTYEWTRETHQPSLSYELDADATVERDGEERHLFAVTDEWGIVRTPSVALRWSGVGADVERDQRVVGEGVAGDHITYLGPYDLRLRETSDQRFRFVVPEAAEMREDPADVLDVLERASERLEMGEADPEVLVIAAPTDGVEWATRGVQRGDADLWVRDVEPLDDPRNTWVHEYVHARQVYEPTAETRWTIEAMADYYAALLTYEAGEIGYDEFRARMESGTDDQYDDVRLVDPDSWVAQADYDKGALVLGHLDRRLRAEADSSLDAVVAAFEGELTHQRFLEIVGDAGGTEIRDDAERYTETTAGPTVWDRQAHVEAFGGPAFRYAFESFAATGPYREAALGADDLRLVAGETLGATVRVENVGEESGEYDAAFTVDGEVVDEATGTLAAGESATLSFEREFADTGEYDLAVGAARATAVVEEPAAVAVRDLAADPAEVAPGEPVVLRATVASTADRPGEGAVQFTVDGDVVTTESVRVGDGETTVETTVTFDEAGGYTVGAGDHETRVTVGWDATTVPGTSAEPGETTYGDDDELHTPADGATFGTAVTVAMLAAAVLLLRRGHDRL